MDWHGISYRWSVVVARPTDTGSAGSIGSGVLPFPLALTVTTQSVEAEDGSGALWEKSSGRGVVRVTLNGPDRPGERRGNVSHVRRSVLGFPESSAPMAGAPNGYSEASG
jgi:hypothetical protein